MTKPDTLHDLIQFNNQALSDLIAKGEPIGIKEQQALIKSLNRDFKSKNPIGKYKPRLSAEQVKPIYQHILEQCVTPENAFEILPLLFPDLDMDYIKQAKNNSFLPYDKDVPMGTNMAKHITTSHDTHPTQQDMKKRGSLDKRILSKSTTPNNLLKSLYFMVDNYQSQLKSEQSMFVLAQSVVNLKQEIEQIKQHSNEQDVCIDTLNQKVTDLSEDMEKLKLDILDNREMDKIVKTKLLSQMGEPNKTVASSLGISERTVRRYLKK